METTIISWTPTNWLTVFLMAAGGFVILKLVVTVLQKYRDGGISSGAADA